MLSRQCCTFANSAWRNRKIKQSKVTHRGGKFLRAQLEAQQSTNEKYKRRRRNEMVSAFVFLPFKRDEAYFPINKEVELGNFKKAVFHQQGESEWMCCFVQSRQRIINMYVWATLASADEIWFQTFMSTSGRAESAWLNFLTLTEQKSQEIFLPMSKAKLPTERETLFHLCSHEVICFVGFPRPKIC